MKTPSLESRYIHGRSTPGDPIMTRQPDRKLWHVTCSGVRWLQARRESESCVRGRARKVSETLRGCGGSCEESSKGLIIDKMNSVPCFLRQISGLTLNGTYRRRRNVCVRVLAASPESDDDSFFLFFLEMIGINASRVMLPWRLEKSSWKLCVLRALAGDVPCRLWLR